MNMFMKTTINKIMICLLAGTLFLSACSDKFFENDPVGSFDEKAYWNSETDVKSWMAGIYSGIQQTLGSNYLHWGESRSDNFLPTIYGGERYQLNNLVSTDGVCNWVDLYSVISRCNMGLENIDRVKGISESNLKLYKGQMYGIRAWMYFYAIRVWGDVPMITKTWDGTLETKYNPRTPVETIKTEIIEKDIEQAINLLEPTMNSILPPAPYGVNCFYFNKGAALALRMDFDLWFGNYDRVIESSNMIESFKLYSLVAYAPNGSNWRNIFLDPGASKETIFTMNWIYPENDNNPYGAIVAASDKNPSFHVSQEVFKVMIRDKKDVRFWGVLDTVKIFKEIGNRPIGEDAIIADGAHYTRGDKIGKFNQMIVNPAGENAFLTPGQGQCDYKLPIYRYADVLLMRATALNKRNQAGDAQEAINIVNKIRARCGNQIVATLEQYPVKDGWGLDSRERLILDERQVEFYGEGKRWFDLRRSGEVFYQAMSEHMLILQGYKLMELVGFQKDGRELFPLHQSVFSANPLLVGKQNPPYSE